MTGLFSIDSEEAIQQGTSVVLCRVHQDMFHFVNTEVQRQWAEEDQHSVVMLNYEKLPEKLWQ